MIEILIVDSNSAHVLLITDCLSQCCPASIKVVVDGEEAVRLLTHANYRPHLVLLELNVPKLSGQEVLKRVRRRNQNIPIIVLSAARSQEDVSRAYASGANMYAEKPSDPEAFRRTICTIAKLWLAPLAVGRAAAGSRS